MIAVLRLVRARQVGLKHLVPDIHVPANGDARP